MSPALTSAPAYDLYIDYADDDESWVRGQLLAALGLPASRYLTSKQFTPGSALVADYDRAVSGSRFIVLIFSPGYLRSRWTSFAELLASHAAAASGRVRVVPILLEDCELPLHIEFLVRLDCRRPENWESEIGRLRALLETPEPAPESLPCPYPGIVPFGKDQAGVFFGREKEIDLIAARAARESLLLLIGPSGSGKSSLVFSGVLPRLENENPGWWTIRTMRPGAKPIDRLNALLNAAPGSGNADWRTRADALLQSTHSGRLLLVIDQLEEVFSLADEAERAGFSAAIQGIARVPRCAVLLTMRADFYGQLLSLSSLTIDTEQQINVLPLRGQGLRDAIIKPAAASGVWIDEKLVDRLMADATGEPGALPMLQETMTLLWRKMERRLIPLSAYLSFDEKLPGLTVALALQGNAALSGMTEAQKRIARRMLLRLVQFGEGRADTRRQQKLENLRVQDDGDDFRSTLDRLVEYRILTLDSDPHAPAGILVDLAHEALIAGWPMLRDLVKDRRGAELTRRTLWMKAEEWVRLGRKQGGLLDPTELAEAETWIGSSAALDVGVDRRVAELIAASRQEADRQQRSRRVAIALLAVLVAIAAVGLAAYLRARSEEALIQGLDTIDRLRASDPAAALEQSVAAFQKLRGKRQDLSSRAEALLADAIQSAQPHGSISIHTQAYGVDLSRDGTRVAGVGSYGAVYVRELLSDNLLTLHQPQDGRLKLSAVRFAPDGRTAAAAGSSGAICQWQLEPGDPGRVLYQHSAPLASLAYSPDGSLLAAGGEDGTIILRDLKGDTERHWKAHAGRINRLQFSRDGRLLAAGASDDATAPSQIAANPGAPGDYGASVWEVATLSQKWSLRGHESEVSGVAFSDDGATLATSSADGYLRLWSLATGKMATAEPVDLEAGLSDVLFAGPKQLLLGLGKTFGAVLWDPAAKHILRLLRGPDGIVAQVAYHPDKPRMAALASVEDGCVRVYYLDPDDALAQAKRLLSVLRPESKGEARK